MVVRQSCRKSDKALPLWELEIVGWSSSMAAGKPVSEGGLILAEEVTLSRSNSSAKGLPSLSSFLCNAPANGALVLLSWL